MARRVESARMVRSDSSLDPEDISTECGNCGHGWIKHTYGRNGPCMDCKTCHGFVDEPPPTDEELAAAAKELLAGLEWLKATNTATDVDTSTEYTATI